MCSTCLHALPLRRALGQVPLLRVPRGVVQALLVTPAMGRGPVRRRPKGGLVLVPLAFYTRAPRAVWRLMWEAKGQREVKG